MGKKAKSLKLQEIIIKRLEDMAAKEQRSQSQVVENALIEYFTRREDK